MYEFSYKTEASDLWQMAMYYTYSNWTGFINVLFTAVMIALTIGTWKDTATILHVILILASCWFVVFQPLIMWKNANKRAKLITFTTKLAFSEQGMHIQVEDQTQDLSWDKIQKFAKLPTMVIIYSDAVHGYVLNNHTLGGKRAEFISYLEKKVVKKS
ncbi:MAG: YcxB family protein [Lachnospira sp.]|nr:YcxB family protein [Lachnospira sp.]